MIRLLTGSGDRFYQSYRHAWTIDPGHTPRTVIQDLPPSRYNPLGIGYTRHGGSLIKALA
jgi:hypothetical protein